ncbi:hypothetical protein [Fulvitalea axinellae]
MKNINGNKFLAIGLSLLGFLFVMACDKDDKKEYEERVETEILTGSWSDVSISAVKLSGKVVTVENGSEISKVGFSYWEQGKLSTRQTIEVDLAEDKTFTVSLDELDSYTQYAYVAFAIQGDTKVEGDVLTFRTLISTEVKDPEATNGGFDSLSFSSVYLKGSYTTGNSNNSEVTFLYWEKEKEELNNPLTAKTETEPDFSIHGKALHLKPGTEYRFCVVALNEVGIGYSDTVDFTTNKMVYVNNQATGDANGSTWEHAFTSIKTAAEESPEGAELWVMAGTYEEVKIPLKNEVDIYGGFSGTETSLEQRDWEANLTIIDGGATGLVNDKQLFEHKYSSKSQASVLDGFTLQHGSHWGGGAIYCRRGSPSIRNCIFKNNWGKVGAAIIFQHGNSEIINCQFLDNIATANAGAINVHEGTNLYVENSVFRGNTASNEGGALFGQGSEAIYKDCVFEDNEGGKGGIIFFNGACAKFINCQYSNNVGKDGRLCSGKYSSDDCCPL